MLPEPGEGRGLAALLRRRRSTKAYEQRPLELDEVSELLWCMSGAVEPARRTYASAHAQYLVATTLVAGEVNGLPRGSYRYLAESHSLETFRPGDHRGVLADATLDAAWLVHCPLVLVLSADIGAAELRFREQGNGRGERFAWLEAGLISQNAYLWAAARSLGTLLIGGLDDATLTHDVAGLVPNGHSVLGLLPVGHPAA